MLKQYVFTINKAASRTLAVQERQLKKTEDISVLQETNRTLKMDKEKLQQELLQAQARVRCTLLIVQQANLL